MRFRNLTLIVLFIIFFILYFAVFSVKEQFEVSSQFDVDAGSSEEWGWGFKGINEDKKKKEKRYLDEENINVFIDEKKNCKDCDITKNKDIDRYVLKSSIPPCPDMSQYATKEMVNSCPDMKDYVLKSKIGEYCDGYYPQSNTYILKSKCVPNDDITQHPDFPNYISKESCKKYKKSFIQNLEDWLFKSSNSSQQNNYPQNGQQQNNPEILPSTDNPNIGQTGFPTGYSYSPYAGYGVDNTGYALDGSNVQSRTIFDNT